MRGNMLPVALLTLAYLAGSCGLQGLAQGQKKPVPGKSAHTAAHTSAHAPTNAAEPQAAKKGVDFTQAYNNYVGRLQGRLFDKWDASEVTGKNRVFLEAMVEKDGSVTQVNLTSTPTNPSAEEAAHQAFNQVQPLEVLPPGSPPARIVLTFDSTYDPHGDSSSNMQAKMYPQNQTQAADNK